MLLRSCLNVDRSWIGDVGDDRRWTEFKWTLASALMLHPQYSRYGPVFQSVNKGRRSWMELDGDDLRGMSSSRTS